MGQWGYLQGERGVRLSSSLPSCFGTRSLAAPLSRHDQVDPTQVAAAGLQECCSLFVPNNLGKWGKGSVLLLIAECLTRIVYDFNSFPQTFTWTLWGESYFLMESWLFHNVCRVSKKMLKYSCQITERCMSSLLEKSSEDGVVGWVMPLLPQPANVQVLISRTCAITLYDKKIWQMWMN